jgi:hypothetical protein
MRLFFDFPLPTLRFFTVKLLSWQRAVIPVSSKFNGRVASVAVGIFPRTG